MKIQKLNGEWILSKVGNTEFEIKAKVPGVVHEALLQNEIIPDPFYRDNEKEQRWVGETEWLYRRTFVVDENLLKQERILLRCHGLDTLATIRINDVEIGHTENMYRTYEFDIKEQLNDGENRIEIAFTSPIAYSLEQEANRGILPTWSVGDHRLNGASYIRKEPSNFGWDWGPQLVTSGIWRDIELVGFSTARLGDVLILQEHGEGVVDLLLKINIEVSQETSLAVKVSVNKGADLVAEGSADLSNHKTEVSLRIENPSLWWIAGMGNQPLYDVDIELVNTDNEAIDYRKMRIGLRTLQLDRHADEWGESFQFTINGLPFFAKGANWIPADVFVSRLKYADYERLIKASVDANMNMLRVWGGGVYELDEFYELCDEYGVAVWQDFMFACGTYPTFDEDFLGNVRAEAEDNVRRLRHHASLALWCGNNEMEQGLVGPEWTDRCMSWEDYGKLFDTLLPEVVEKLSPQTDYWPASPHSPCGDRMDWENQTCGDTHLWYVWHRREPFEWYRTRYDRFVSEFGFQSFPSPQIVSQYTELEDRNITSYIMEYHQRSGIGNSTIIHYMLDWFLQPTSFEATIWLSQILQGMAIKYAVEHWRRNMPRTMGTLYWQLNDLWPGPTWSSLDWLGNWKTLHYMAKRFYAPILVSGVEKPEQCSVEVDVSSDHNENFSGSVDWKAIHVDGNILEAGKLQVDIEHRSSKQVGVIDLNSVAEKYGARNLVIWLELYDEGGQLVSDNLVLFERPKHLNIQKPVIETTLHTNDADLQQITLQSDVPALWVWLETNVEGVHFEDNFFHLHPDQPRTITIQSEARLNKDDVVVQSLVDTF